MGLLEMVCIWVRFVMKIYTACPKPFFQEWMLDSYFFSRDMGLTCHALREAGIDSRVVLLRGPTTKEHPDIIRADLADMENPAWWREHALDAVVLGAWAAPSFTPVARAIKESGARLIIRCDNGGPYSQREKGFRRSWQEHYLDARYDQRGLLFSSALAAIKTPLFYVPALFDRRVVEHMSYADLIMNETPEGVAGLRSFLARVGRHDIAARVLYAPHPIKVAISRVNLTRKKPQWVAVGRWDSYQKNAMLLLDTLRTALVQHPEHTAVIVGKGESGVMATIDNWPLSLRDKVKVTGPMPHDALAVEYARSQVVLAPSRSESFNLAVAEALCHGCTLVGSGHISSFRYFASRNSGTLASSYTLNAFLDALNVETQAWENGLRDAVSVAKYHTAEFAPQHVTSLILETAQGREKFTCREGARLQPVPQLWQMASNEDQ